MRNVRSFSLVSVVVLAVAVFVLLVEAQQPPLLEQVDVQTLIEFCMSPTGEKIMQPAEPGTDRAIFCAGLPFVALYLAVDVRNAEVRDQMITNQNQFVSDIAAIQQTLAVNGSNISSNTLTVAGMQAQVSANTSQVAVNTPAIADLGARVTAIENSPPLPQGFFNGFEGAGFDAWLVPPGASLTVDSDNFTGTQSGRIGYSGSANPKSFNETGGVAIEIPATFALSYGGKTITISFRAKQPFTGASSQFAVSYSTDDVGNSGWQQFTPTTSWQPFSFTYAVPIPNAGGTDFLGFWGDTSNNGLGVLVDDLRITTL